MNYSALLLAGVLVAPAIPALVYAAVRESVWPYVALLAAWFVTTALRDSVDLSVTLSGLRIEALDVLAAAFAVVGAGRLLTRGVTNVTRGLVGALFLLLVVHLVRGAGAHGPAASINDGRNWFYFCSALLLTATMPVRLCKEIWKVVVVQGAVLIGVAVVYLAVDGVHSATATVYRNGEWTTTRPLTATGALLVLEAGIVAAATGWPSRVASRWFAAVAGVMVILLQHRTLWVAGGVVAVYGLLVWSNRRVREGDSQGFGVLGLVLLVLPAVVWAFSRTGSLVASLRETTSSRSTFAWRTTSWSELIGSHHHASDVLFGGPSAASRVRLIHGVAFDQNPHDGYVDAYLRFGLPGVAAIILVYLLLWRRRSVYATAAGLSPDAVLLLLVTQCIFGIAYSLDAVQGVILGALVAASVAARRLPVSARRPLLRPPELTAAVALGRGSPLRPRPEGSTP